MCLYMAINAEIFLKYIYLFSFLFKRMKRDTISLVTVGEYVYVFFCVYV